MTYSMYVTINLPYGKELDFAVQKKSMSQGALEDAIINILNNNPTASSFVLTICRNQQAET